MSRGSSSGLDVAIEKIDTGASWPWNLSTVPTRDRRPIRRSIAPWISRDVGVVRRDDQDVLAGQRPGDAVLVRPRPADEPADQLRHGVRLVGRARRVARVRHRLIADPGPALPPIGLDRVGRVGHEAALVEQLGHEVVDPRVHAVGARQEQAALGRQRASAAEDVLQGRRPGAVGMDALADLRQLVAGRRAGRSRGRPSPPATAFASDMLAGLVDEQDVDASDRARAGRTASSCRRRRRPCRPPGPPRSRSLSASVTSRGRRRPRRSAGSPGSGRRPRRPASRRSRRAGW